MTMSVSDARPVSSEVMSMAPRAFASSLAVLFLAAALAPARGQDQGGSLDERVGRLIDRLGDPDFETREAATRELAEIGEAALPGLRRAASGDDPEVAWRAKKVAALIEAERERRAQRTPPPEGPRSRGSEDPDFPAPPFPGQPQGMGDLEDMTEQLQRLSGELQRVMDGGLFEGFQDLTDPDAERQMDGMRRILDWMVESQLEGVEDPETRDQIEGMRRVMDFAFRGLGKLEDLERGREEIEPSLPERPRPRAVPEREARWGGLAGSRVDPGLRVQLGVPEDQGLLVSEVEEGTEAATWGFERWDLILTANGRPIGNVDDYRREIEATAAGDTIVFEVVRRGARTQVRGNR